jgi:NTE family protein
VISNYPLFLFDSTKYMDDATVLVNQPVVNAQTLGLLMEMPEQIAHNQQQNGHYAIPIHTMRDYIKALYITLIDKPNPDGNLRRTVSISNMNLSGRIRKISRATLDGFVECGREGVRRFFEAKSLAESRH